MTEQGRFPAPFDLSFADSSILSFTYNEKKQTLIMTLELWNEKLISLSFDEVIYCVYRSGDVISEVYEDRTGNFIVEEPLRPECPQAPTAQGHKLIDFCDINDLFVMRVVCKKYSLSEELTP